MKEQKFRKLEVWRKDMDFIEEIYKIISGLKKKLIADSECAG